MKQNSFISVILTIACSLMFVACSDWTEPTPVDYNPIFPDEQDPSLHEKYEQSLKEYKNRKHTLMLIRFANNPGTTLGEQDFLRSLPDRIMGFGVPVLFGRVIAVSRLYQKTRVGGTHRTE